MSARVLVVDDVPANVKLLEARLSAEYFDVITAQSGPEALALCERAECDIVLLDVMMPDMDGFEVCRKLKSNPLSHHIPVVMVTALDQPSDRVRGLEAGADDFLTKPVSDVALISRVRSLARLKMVTDELRLRALTSKEIGIESPEREAVAETGRNGRILVVDDRKSSYERIVATLSAEHTVDVESNPSEALFHAAEANYDLLIVSLGLKDFDGLRLCSQVRSLERTRNVPILAVAEPDNNTRLVRGLEIGVNDYLLRPIDKNEMLARVRTQIKKKRYTERLRDNVQMSIEMAITDALTGLFNRRYMESHLGTLVEQAAARGKPIAVLVVDIDYFKAVNDSHGHDAGDDVLREFALRIRKSIRNIDLACRYGGEEFVIVMPETDMAVATMVAERLRRRIASDPFAIQQGARNLDVTISIGIAALAGDERQCGGDPQARRYRALSRQARRPQPGCARCRLGGLRPNDRPALFAEFDQRDHAGGHARSVVDQRRLLAFVAGHGGERVLAGHERDIRHALLEGFEAVEHRRLVRAQHVEAGIEGDDLDFDLVAFVGIIFRHIGGDVEHGIHLGRIVVADLQRQAMLFHRVRRRQGERQQQERGEQSARHEGHGWLSRGKSVSTVSGPQAAEYSGAEMRRARKRAPWRNSATSPGSLDLGFLVFDVLLGDRIVFLLRQLVGLGARILAGHVVVAGAGAGHELDLQTDGFGHGTILET